MGSTFNSVVIYFYYIYLDRDRQNKHNPEIIIYNLLLSIFIFELSYTKDKKKVIENEYNSRKY